MKVSIFFSSKLRARARSLAALLWALALTLAVMRPAAAQNLNSIDRGRARDILKVIKDDLKKNYYDEGYRGIDLEAWFKDADAKLTEATSIGQAWGVIAQALTRFDDSHTYFIPPSRHERIEYGWQMKTVGEKCYVSAVKPGSDAEKKGLAVGDEVVGVDGYAPLRENLWKLKYMYYSLRPRAGMRLLVRKPDGREQQLDVLAKVEELKQIRDPSDTIEYWQLVREAEEEDRLYRNRFYEVGDDLLVWKMSQFAMDDAEVDSVMGKVRKHKALVLDLRGNGGGYVKTLDYLIGYFFDHDLKIADLKGRKEMKPDVAKTRGDKIFKGQVVVLVDSESASAAELFARVMQLEKRGTVVGDRTQGAVMQSLRLGHQSGVDVAAFYGVSVTNADLIMSDGKSLEHSGVTPDELVLPSAADMAAGRDPALARAAAIVGVRLEPDKAGALFPVEWRK